MVFRLFKTVNEQHATRMDKVSSCMSALTSAIAVAACVISKTQRCRSCVVVWFAAAAASESIRRIKAVKNSRHRSWSCGTVSPSREGMHTGDQLVSGSMLKEGKREDKTGAAGGLGWSPVPGTTGENHSESPFSMYIGVSVDNDDEDDDDDPCNDSASDAAIGAAVCTHRSETKDGNR